MSWDYFVYIAENSGLREETDLPEGLVGGFVDEVSVRFFAGDKVDARNRYMEKAYGEIQIPQMLSLSTPNFAAMLSQWLGLQVDFELLTPWYSKDDRLFHVMDNPVRKDWVFGVPFMSASSWKGMLRWAFQMHTKLIGPERESDEEKRKQARDWELHLFGNEKGEEKHFHQGALVFYPTWFDKIGFEVINPHSRERRAGTQPIYYEVVPSGTEGKLYLLYAPWEGMKYTAKTEEVIPELLKTIDALIISYGFSAKRTMGWGAASIKSITVFYSQDSWIAPLIHQEENHQPPQGDFLKLLDPSTGEPLSILLDSSGNLLSKTKFKKLGGNKPGGITANKYQEFKEWYERYGETYKLKLQEKAGKIRNLTQLRTFTSISELLEKIESNHSGDMS